MKLLLRLTSIDFIGTAGVRTGRTFYLNPNQITQVYPKGDRSAPYTEIVLINSDRVWCLETPDQIDKAAK